MSSMHYCRRHYAFTSYIPSIADQTRLWENQLFSNSLTDICYLDWLLGLLLCVLDLKFFVSCETLCQLFEYRRVNKHRCMVFLYFTFWSQRAFFKLKGIWAEVVQETGNKQEIWLDLDKYSQSYLLCANVSHIQRLVFSNFRVKFLHLSAQLVLALTVKIFIFMKRVIICIL